jgi:hypothetical protein
MLVIEGLEGTEIHRGEERTVPEYQEHNRAGEENAGIRGSCNAFSLPEIGEPERKILLIHLLP